MDQGPARNLLASVGRVPGQKLPVLRGCTPSWRRTCLPMRTKLPLTAGASRPEPTLMLKEKHPRAKGTPTCSRKGQGRGKSPLTRNRPATESLKPRLESGHPFTQHMRLTQHKDHIHTYIRLTLTRHKTHSHRYKDMDFCSHTHPPPAPPSGTVQCNVPQVTQQVQASQ